MGLFWLNWAGLPPVVLGPNILSKGVETGPTATQFGPNMLTASKTVSDELWQVDMIIIK